MDLHYIRKLGEGASGEVWLAEELNIGTQFAAKFFSKVSPEQAGGDAVIHAQPLAAVEHRAVVKVYCVEMLQPHPGTGKPTPAIIMEYVDGKTLDEHKGIIEKHHAHRIILDLVEGIDAIHHKGIAHGDLYDKNVILATGGGAKIIDIFYLRALADRGSKSAKKTLREDVRDLANLVRQVLERIPNVREDQLAEAFYTASTSANTVAELINAFAPIVPSIATTAMQQSASRSLVTNVSVAPPLAAKSLNKDWFEARLGEALKTAGPRYTPPIHVELPIADDFEAFGRTERFFNQVRAHARSIRNSIRSLIYSQSKFGDPKLDQSAFTLVSLVEKFLAEFSTISLQPTGDLPFRRIATQAASAVAASENLEGLLREHYQEHSVRSSATIANLGTTNSDDQRRKRLHEVMALRADLQEAQSVLIRGETQAGGTLMLLKGAAGTGKTHLLCDVAKHRIDAGRPTVLLMGQQFVSADAPWIQALQQLDLAGISADEFVTRLETAAQIAGCRALLLVDAINEGSGRLIWPGHLAAFLAHLERSPWIGVVLSVRSSYEELMVPEAVRARALTIIHEGFAEREYDAARTFFVYYGIDLPSTPLLSSEFRNPLFLKTLCVGLKAKGECRLPRGFHGITVAFEFYLSAINARLASMLGFNPKSPLVRLALEEFARALVGSSKRWLTLPAAEQLVNTLLPNREFERSLYRGLVVEGVLVEENVRTSSTGCEEFVFVAYERFADHFIAKILLDAHLDMSLPASAFVEGGPLAFIWDESHYLPRGVLEAMCIQIAERTGQELPSLAPRLMNRWGVGGAYRQSLVWRSINAFSESTHEYLETFIRSTHDLHDTLEVLLTVATLPGHPFNAQLLDKRLRSDSMPTRDAWWSTYLHRAWQTHSAVHRIVDWASSVTPETAISDEAVDLCATTLSWMLAASNRFVRDRATKALVSLLTCRLDGVCRLIEKFADVDDPYVSERIYSVAYGAAMRTSDRDQVGKLAGCVYSQVFAAGTPPAHVLLRDYAREVIELALYQGTNIDIIVERIRPPYRSEWPTIPTEEDIKPLRPNWPRGFPESGSVEWARMHIINSVMENDFARYVIGTNSSTTSDSWLCLKLGEEAWTPPRRPDDRLVDLVAEFSTTERDAWEAFNTANRNFEHAMEAFVSTWYAKRRQDGDLDGDDGQSNVEAVTREFEEACPPEVTMLGEQLDAARITLDASLAEEHARHLAEIRAAKDAHQDLSRPPRFELRQIQRYILWRVFDLGWTVKRFGDFDRFEVRDDGRSASKAERIGKKYQWIAYHEIMALIADHFQYRESFRETDVNHAYDGPWQMHFRNIDPSCTIRASRGGTTWEGHSPAWWGSPRYENWNQPDGSREWVKRYDDLPAVDALLRVVNPSDASQWVNVAGYFDWKQQPPVDQESTDVERREFWYICTGYLVRDQDADLFMKWAESVDFWGRWMPEPSMVYQMFLGEHAWSPAFRYFQRQHDGEEVWTQPDHGCPVKVQALTLEYLCEAGGFDCSVEKGYMLRLPASNLVAGMGLQWDGNSASYFNEQGILAAQDPTAHSDGPSALLLREDLLRQFLVRENLSVCWTILGEKRVLGPGLDPEYHPSLHISGVYLLGKTSSTGFVKCIFENWDKNDPHPSSTLLATIRSSA